MATVRTGAIRHFTATEVEAMVAAGIYLLAGS